MAHTHSGATQAHQKKSVALSSVFASVFLTLIKLVVGITTGSLGIISEAAHSALDFVAALLTFFAVRVGDKPADKDHPYGHTKMESVSALIETGLLFLTSAWIIYEAVKRLFFKNVHVETAWYALVIIVISIVVDISRSRALRKVATATHSQALEADALHFSSDIWSSLAVLVGLLAVQFGIGSNADSIAALVVAGLVLVTGYKLGKRTIDVLVDAAPEGITDRITHLAKGIDGVLGVAKVRVRHAGAFFFADLTVHVHRKLSLEKVQEICNRIEQQIERALPGVDLTVHAVPLSQDNETIIERVQLIAARHNLAVHDIVAHSQAGRTFVSFDLEVTANLTIGEAHATATQLETAIQNELGSDLVINTHIEPLRNAVMPSASAPPEETAAVNDAIGAIAATLPGVRGTHDVRVRQSDRQLFVTLHCYFDAETPLEDAHNLASRFEYRLKEKIPHMQRAVVHVEPAAAGGAHQAHHRTVRKID
ncbi:MAG: cation-efflux pump [Patescibacteria group bacterium]|nr:cation-efflux pump [Patescibacteria group bacterium]